MAGYPLAVPMSGQFLFSSLLVLCLCLMRASVEARGTRGGSFESFNPPNEQGQQRQDYGSNQDSALVVEVKPGDARRAVPSRWRDREQAKKGREALLCSSLGYQVQVNGPQATKPSPSTTALPRATTKAKEAPTTSSRPAARNTPEDAHTQGRPWVPRRPHEGSHSCDSAIRPAGPS